MTGVDKPPPPDGQEVSTAVAERGDLAELPAPQPGWLTSGSMIAIVLCVPAALVFIWQTVQAAQQHRWDAAAGLAWVSVCFLGVPALGAKPARWLRERLGHVFKGRKPPEPPPSFI